MQSEDAQIRDLLTKSRTIAVVGLSDKPDRDSNEIARYLIDQGYRVVPVNPALTEVLGQKSYPDLTSIPSHIAIDIVDIFRKSEQVPPIVEEALRRGRPAIWMQTGISNPLAAALAREAGVPVFENLCIRVQHRRLHIPPRPPQG